MAFEQKSSKQTLAIVFELIIVECINFTFEVSLWELKPRRRSDFSGWFSKSLFIGSY